MSKIAVGDAIACHPHEMETNGHKKRRCPQAFGKGQLWNGRVCHPTGRVCVCVGGGGGLFVPLLPDYTDHVSALKHLCPGFTTGSK